MMSKYSSDKILGHRLLLILAASGALLASTLTPTLAQAQTPQPGAAQDDAGTNPGALQSLRGPPQQEAADPNDPESWSKHIVTVDANRIETSTGYITFGTTATYLHPVAPTKNGFDFGVDTSWLKGQTDDLLFDYESAAAKLIYNFNHTKYELNLGVMNRNDNLDTSAQALLGHVNVTQSYEKINATLEVGHGVYADSLQSDFGTRDFLQGPYGGLTVNARPFKRLRAAYVEHLIFLNDGNRRSDADVSLMYGLSPDWPWIWLGAGYERITDSITSNLYWSPRIFSDIGPRLDIAAPIYQELSFALGLNLNWFNDVDYGSGFGYYGTAKLLYGPSDGRHVSVGFESIDSKQGSSKWTSTGFNAGVQWPF